MNGEQKQAAPETSLDASRVFPRLPVTDLEAVKVGDVRIFDPGMLVEGCCHQIVAPYQSGKTFLALACGIEFLKSGLKILYMDYENRKSSIKGRCDLLGSKAEDRENLLYVNHPNLDLSKDSQAQWAEFLEYHKPDLIIFDSQSGFLSKAGRDENSATGFQEWANEYLEVPKVLGMTTLVIDHTGWDGTASRGTSRKPDQFDIIWKVKVKKKFSRRKVGQLELKIAKDRDSFLPYDCLTFEIGGDPFQFEASAIENKGSDLSDDQKKTLSLISQNSKDQIGTQRKSINELFNGSKSRADKTITFLLTEHLIYQSEGSKLYWTVDSFMNSSSNTESPEDTTQSPELDSSVDTVDGNGEGVLGSRSFRTGPMDPAPPTEPDSSLEQDNGKNTIEKKNNTSIETQESPSLNESTIGSIVADSRVLLEMIEDADFESWKTEILKALASVLLDHPMLLAASDSEFIKRNISTTISLVGKKGVKMGKRDFVEALKLLNRDFHSKRSSKKNSGGYSTASPQLLLREQNLVSGHDDGYYGEEGTTSTRNSGV